MTRPTAIDEAVEAVRRATRSLTLAAACGDGEQIQREIDGRGTAVAELGRALELAGPGLDGNARGRLLRELALEAGEAEAALGRCAADCRRQLDDLRCAAATLRSYAKISRDPSALDRVG